MATQSAINPQMIAQIKSIMQNANSPQMRMAKQFLNEKNINAKQAVEMLCKQKGIDVNSFMEQINSAFK